MAYSSDATGGREEDRPSLDIACISPKHRHAALVSTAGNHCKVWRSTLKRHADDVDDGYVEYVIKYPVDRYGLADARILVKQYRLLRDALGEIVPEALFVMSCIEGVPNLTGRGVHGEHPRYLADRRHLSTRIARNVRDRFPGYDGP